MKIAVTGHRLNRLGGYDNQPNVDLFAIKIIKDAINQFDKPYLITGMAIGWDIAIAKACIKLSVPFHAHLPFNGQESKWPAHVQKEYNKILKHADQTTIVCDGGYAAYKMQERNKSMVDESDIIVALWNGEPSGTGNCIKYAESNDVKVINVWDKWEAYDKKRKRNSKA
jgi:uncharacterized phage-like protein YoqJ